MKKILDTVLLLALPASGKSEVRRYLHLLSPKVCGEEFHMGPTVQLDDFPYVHLMRRIDDELEKMGMARVFFKSGDRPFIDPRDWGTLIQLVNEDYADLVAHKALKPASVAPFLFERIDAAAAKTGIPARLAPLDAGVRAKAANAATHRTRRSRISSRPTLWRMRSVLSPTKALVAPNSTVADPKITTAMRKIGPCLRSFGICDTTTPAATDPIACADESQP